MEYWKEVKKKKRKWLSKKKEGNKKWKEGRKYAREE